MVSLISFLLIAAAFTVSASFTVVFSKLLYQTKSKGIHDNEPVYFNKPWFLDWLMFVSEFLILVAYWVTVCYKKGRGSPKNKSIDNEKYTPLISHPKPVKKEWKTALSLFPPAVLDLLSGLCTNLALMWIPASIAQLLKGSLTIFLAILTICYRKRRLYRNEWIGVCLVTLSIFALGAAAFLNEGHEVGEATQSTLLSILGVLLALLGMAMMAFLSVYEEKLLHDVNIPAMKTIGWEGLYGAVIITFILFPVCYFLPGPEGYAFHENELDSFVMLKNNWFAALCAALYVVASFFFNTLFMIIMDIKDALTSSILQQLSNVVIWASALVIYYGINSDYGEPWNQWSFIELGGFVLMVTGVFVYQGVIKMGFLMGPHDAKKSTSLMDASADAEEGGVGACPGTGGGLDGCMGEGDVGGMGAAMAMGSAGLGNAGAAAMAVTVAAPVGTPFVVDGESDDPDRDSRCDDAHGQEHEQEPQKHAGNDNCYHMDNNNNSSSGSNSNKPIQKMRQGKKYGRGGGEREGGINDDDEDGREGDVSESVFMVSLGGGRK